VVLHDFESESSHTTGINFLLFDHLGEEITLSDKIEVIHHAPRKVTQIIQKILNEDATLSYLKKRAYMFEILSNIASSSSKIDEIIFPGFAYLSEHFDEPTPVSDLAKMCNISEVYFRKRFRECLGESPVEYRNRLRLEKAREYLEYGDISVQEISDLIGYSTVSHFIKEFKKHYEIPPLNYRKMQER
jgi:AraC-like DNA-binding protein